MFYKHEGLFDLERDTGLPIRLSFSGLWTCCDREGRFKWRPRELKSDILPHDDVDFSRVLDALWTRGFVRRYRVDGEDYGYIPSWHAHQVINNRESKSTIPEPQESFVLQVVDASITREAREDDARPTRLKHALVEGKGREYGKEKELKPCTRKPRAIPKASEVLSQDTRHTRVQSLIVNAYRENNSGADCPWDGSEGAHLKRLLIATPRWADSQIAQCLANMYASTGFAVGSRPREWLEKLPRYLNGPLNEFNREKSSYVSKAQQRQDSSHDAIRAAAARVFGTPSGNPASGLSLPGDDAGNGGIVLEGDGRSGLRSGKASTGSGG